MGGTVAKQKEEIGQVREYEEQSNASVDEALEEYHLQVERRRQRLLEDWTDKSGSFDA